MLLCLSRIPYRGDSGMNDAVSSLSFTLHIFSSSFPTLSSRSLTIWTQVLGGYHDAGDHVKFGFPMAAMTVGSFTSGTFLQIFYPDNPRLGWRLLLWRIPEGRPARMVANISYYINLSIIIGWTNASSGQQTISWPPIQQVKATVDKTKNNFSFRHWVHRTNWWRRPRPCFLGKTRGDDYEQVSCFTISVSWCPRYCGQTRMQHMQFDTKDFLMDSFKCYQDKTFL